jgi:hypothetical protein
LTFHIKEGIDDRQFKEFVGVFTDPKKCPFLNATTGYHMWIVKPGENTNRGYGITVTNELSEIKQIISEVIVNGVTRSYIIQKYCERPLLYKNRKFDIRCFVLVTNVNGNL